METGRVKITNGLLRFIWLLFLLSTGILLYPITKGVCAQQDVQLVATDYGPAVENQLVVRFCNNFDYVYTIVLECMTKSYTLSWTCDDQCFQEKTFFLESNSCDPQHDNGFTFLLIQRENLADDNYSYISQLRVNTSTLKNFTPPSGQMKVTCKALDTNKEIVFIQVSDGNQPEIQNVFRGNNMNELIVLWTSNNSDIVNVSITLESNGQNMTPNTDWYKKGASITVDDNKSPYTVKVMEQSKCGQNFYSGGYQYKYEEPDTASGTSGGFMVICVLALVTQTIIITC